jgi:ribose transport system substrate-binding protein
MANETIAVFTKNRTNPAYDAARIGAERAAARMGARALHFVPERPDDIEQQIALVDRALEARPDAMVFVPVHLTALDGAVRKVNAAGIPIVNILNRMPVGEVVTFVGSDDYGLGRAIAGYLFRNLGGKGEVAMMEGVPAAVTSRDRVRGFRDAAREWPAIRLTATPPGDFQETTARRVMAEFLARGPRVDGVLAANDAMALGVLSALEAAGRSTPVIGVNAVPDAITAVKAGRLLATVDFDALKISSIATEAALRHLRGERVPPEIILPTQIVDRANCGAWDVPLERRQPPAWSDVVR